MLRSVFFLALGLFNSLWCAAQTDSMPSPYAWYQKIRANAEAIQFEFIEGRGHGMMFSEFNSSVRNLGNARSFYRSHGLNAGARQDLQKKCLSSWSPNFDAEQKLRTSKLR